MATLGTGVCFPSLFVFALFLFYLQPVFPLVVLVNKEDAPNVFCMKAVSIPPSFPVVRFLNLLFSFFTTICR